MGDHQRGSRRPTAQSFYITTTEEHPGERHLYTMSINGGARTKITALAGSNQAVVSPDAASVGFVHSYSNTPPEVYVMPNQAGAAAAKQVTTTPTAEWRSFQVDRSQGPDVQGARRRRRLRAAVHAGDDRRPTRSVACGRRLRPRRGLRAERAPLLVELLPRVHVPQSAGLARLCRPRRRLPRQLRLRARLAHRHLSAHGRQGSRGHRRRREVPRRRTSRSTRSALASTAAATAASSR